MDQALHFYSFLEKTPHGVHQKPLSISIILHWIIVLKHSRSSLDWLYHPTFPGKYRMKISPGLPGVTEPAVVKLFPLFRESLHSPSASSWGKEQQTLSTPPCFVLNFGYNLWPVNKGFDIHEYSRWMGPLSPGMCWATISLSLWRHHIQEIFFLGEALHFWPSSSEVSHLEPFLFSKARQAKMVSLLPGETKFPFPKRMPQISGWYSSRMSPIPDLVAQWQRVWLQIRRLCVQITPGSGCPLCGHVGCPSPGHFLLPHHSVAVCPTSLLKGRGWAAAEWSFLAGGVLKVSSKLHICAVYLQLPLIQFAKLTGIVGTQMWLHVWVPVLLVPKSLWKGKDLFGAIRSLCMSFLRLNNPNFSPSLLAFSISNSPTTLMALTELASLCQWGFFVDSVETSGCGEPKLSHQDLYLSA